VLQTRLGHRYRGQSPLPNSRRFRFRTSSAMRALSLTAMRTIHRRHRRTQRGHRTLQGTPMRGPTASPPSVTSPTTRRKTISLQFTSGSHQRLLGQHCGKPGGPPANSSSQPNPARPPTARPSTLSRCSRAVMPLGTIQRGLAAYQPVTLSMSAGAGSLQERPRSTSARGRQRHRGILRLQASAAATANN